jgi:syntaxin-binding protein 1
MRSVQPQTTSLRSAKPNWHKAAKPGGPVHETRQRIMVFVAGGVTYSEVREAYQLSNTLGKDIYIGMALVSFTTNYTLIHSRQAQHTP